MKTIITKITVLNFEYLLLGVSIALFLYVILSIIIRKLVNKEREVINGKLKELENNQKETIDYFKKAVRINRIILKETLLTPNDRKTVNKIAKVLISYSKKNYLNILDWRNYGISETILNEMDKLLIEEEVQRLSQKG